MDQKQITERTIDFINQYRSHHSEENKKMVTAMLAVIFAFMVNHESQKDCEEIIERVQRMVGIK